MPLSPNSVDEDFSKIIVPRSRSPLKFFLLVFALSIPFGLIGTVTQLHLLPGLPVSALMVFCPATAASILVFRETKTSGVKELLKRSFDYKRIRAKVWYAPMVLLMPGVSALVYGLMRLMGLPLPTPQFPVLEAVAMLFAFFIGALGEELGWSGYAIDPMQERLNALQAGILLGLIWAVWHMVPLIQTHRSWTWIAWWCLYTVAGRVLLTWLYNNSGKSVFAASVYHAISNLSWQLFPNHGSHWNPRITGIIVTVVAVIVTVVWGPRTLARYRSA